MTLTRTQKRMGDMSLLLIGIRSPDYAANLRYAEALTQKLRALPPTVVNLATYDVRDLRAFYQQNKWLFVSEDDLESIRDRLRNEISKRKNPLFVSLDEEEPIDKMQSRLEHHDGLDERFPGGIFSSNNGEYVWIAALPPGGLFVEHAGESLFNKANELIKNDPPSRYHPEMTARVSGPIATGIANRQAVVDDIVMVTTSCMVIVILSIGFYFRRLRAIPLTGIPAAIGAAIAFAVADLAFGYLTESTSFLGSIIVGNGINYAIVLMSRYEEHRARGEDPEASLCAAMAGVWRGTLVASIAASAAYASLMVTSFRGFYQFGVMGAVGSLACWAATFTALPALLVLLDRRPGQLSRVHRPPIEFAPLGRLLARRSGTITALFTLLSIVGLFGMRHFLKDPFEYDFGKLAATLKTTESAQQFNHSVDHLFGRWPSPTIVLADGVDEVEPIKQAIRRQDQDFPGPDVIGQMTTIWDLLPGVPEVQERKLALIAQIRKLTHDPSLELLNAKEKADLAKLDPPAGLRELTPGDLPPFARRPFTETDGTIGRVVLVYPPERRALGLERARSAEDRLGPAVSAPAEREGGRDLGLGGGLLLDDSLDPPRRPDRHRRLVDRGVDHRLLHHPPRGRRVDGAGHADARRPPHGRGRRVGPGARDVPELHRAADHLRHRGRVRAQRHHPLPRGEGRREGGRLDRRRGRALLLDHDRRLRLAAGRAQPGPAGLRSDGHPGRGLLPLRRHHRPSGGAALAEGAAALRASWYGRAPRRGRPTGARP